MPTWRPCNDQTHFTAARPVATNATAQWLCTLAAMPIITLRRVALL